MKKSGSIRWYTWIGAVVGAIIATPLFWMVDWRILGWLGGWRRVRCSVWVVSLNEEITFLPNIQKNTRVARGILATYLITVM